MAGPYYVRSTDGSDASDGLTWANAKATLVGALAIAAAGERIWVSQAHAETQASAMTLTSAGTAAAPIEILCGNDAAEPPTALATTATVTTTGANAITLLNSVLVYGITFSCGTGATRADMTLMNGSAAERGVFDTCAFILGTTPSTALLSIGNSTSVARLCRWINSSLKVGNAGQGLQLQRGVFEWAGGSVDATGSIPTSLFRASAHSGLARVTGVDLSALDAGESLVNITSLGTVGWISFEQCKLGTSVALTTGTNLGSGPRVSLDNCDSADTNYRMQRHQYEGDVYSETTIVRTSGASDGTTALSHKMVSSADSKFYAPLYSPEIVAYQLATGSAVTATVEVVHDSTTTQVDSAMWLELEYLGTEGFPIATMLSDRSADILAASTPQTASTVTWTTTGLAMPNKQALAVTFTPLQIGIIRGRVALATPSYTIYVDPLMTVA